MKSFSALQRAEIAEIDPQRRLDQYSVRFSALQRAEIAEIRQRRSASSAPRAVSVLFNEPKLLKSTQSHLPRIPEDGVSVLFNEPKLLK